MSMKYIYSKYIYIYIYSLLPEEEQKMNMMRCYKNLEVLVEKVNMIISILNLLKKSFG